MIYEKLVSIIRNKQDEILNIWIDEFRNTRTLRIEAGIDEDKWKRMMQDVLDGFDDMITKDISKYRICIDFTQLGKECFDDNYAMHDIIDSLTLLKKVIMEVVSAEGFFGTAYQMYQLQELNNRASLYFDRALYYAALGYEETLKAQLGDKGALGKLKRFLGSPDGRTEHMETCVVELDDE